MNQDFRNTLGLPREELRGQPCGNAGPAGNAAPSGWCQQAQSATVEPPPDSDSDRQILVENNRLQATLEIHEELLKMLESRLVPVMSQSMPRDVPPAEANGLNCPLAALLNEYAVQVKGFNATVTRLLLHIQL